MASTTAADLAPSFVRTAVPLVVGPLLARYGFSADDPDTVMLLSALLGWVYYVAVRVMELKAPTLGYLLGIAKPPTYLNPPAVVIDEDGTREYGEPEDADHEVDPGSQAPGSTRL
jgi:hypothetical protein